MDETTIFITEKDYARIRNAMSLVKSNDYENLELELERAKIISDDEVPPNLVTMNSRVKFFIVQENKEMIVTVVYPDDANTDEGRVSILDPLGSALIGLLEKHEINWMFPDGKTKTLRILKVLYQPEANQDWHL